MTLRGWADLYVWQLDQASRTPHARQIDILARSAVLSGALHPGTPVPFSRAMASKLGVVRATVVLAYEHLLAEGYVESRHGPGTFIAGDLPGLASPRRGGPRATKYAATQKLHSSAPHLARLKNLAARRKTRSRLHQGQH